MFSVQLSIYHSGTLIEIHPQTHIPRSFWLFSRMMGMWMYVPRPLCYIPYFFVKSPSCLSCELQRSPGSDWKFMQHVILSNVMCFHGLLGGLQKADWGITRKHIIEGVIDVCTFFFAVQFTKSHKIRAAGAPYSLLRAVKNPVVDHLPGGCRRIGLSPCAFFPLGSFESLWFTANYVETFILFVMKLCLRRQGA